MPDVIQPDINFQPPVKSYAYSSSNPVPNTPANQETQNSNNNSGEKKSNIFITLVFSMLGFLLIFFIFLVILNYFNVIALNNLSPAFNNFPKSQLTKEEFLKSITPKEEPKPYNIPGTNEFTIEEGTLEKYDQNFVYIKFFKKTVAVEYTYDSKFYFTKTFMNTEDATPAAETIAIIDFPSNVLNKENLGKRVSVQYRIEKNKNILESLTLNK